MVDDDTFTKIAKADLTMKLVCGVIIGPLAIIGGIVLIIVFAVKQLPELIGCGIAIMLAGILVTVIDGIILYKRKNKSDKSE